MKDRERLVKEIADILVDEDEAAYANWSEKPWVQAVAEKILKKVEDHEQKL